MKVLVVTACSLLALLLHEVKAQFGNHRMELKPGVFIVSWTYNKTSKRFNFRIEANTTGWVAFGLSEGDGKEMKSIDIALGGVRNGTAYLNDYHSESQKQPDLDGYQDLTLTKGSEDGGQTVLEFNRKADTGDSIQDAKIEESKKYTLCFAIAVNDTVNSTFFDKHSDKGCSPMKYAMYYPDATTARPPTTAGHITLPSLMVFVLTQVAISILY